MTVLAVPAGQRLEGSPRSRADGPREVPAIACDNLAILDSSPACVMVFAGLLRTGLRGPWMSRARPSGTPFSGSGRDRIDDRSHYGKLFAPYVLFSARS
jgi:hypothetical protein